MGLDGQEREALELVVAEEILWANSHPQRTIGESEEAVRRVWLAALATERPAEREALEVIEGLFRAGLWHAKMSGFEQQRLIERTERVLQRHGRKLPTGAMRDIERPAAGEDTDRERA